MKKRVKRMKTARKATKLRRYLQAAEDRRGEGRRGEGRRGETGGSVRMA